MNKKLMSRILGALASALIIVSVFVPFISTKAFSINLWDTFKMADASYLPIMIIIFGAIGVIFFSLNVKTEFAYMSTGAIIFFIVMRTIDIIDQNTFNTLGIGYYLLVIGTVLTGVMAFINNLKVKKKEESVADNLEIKQPSMLDQIDKLYNEQPSSQINMSQIQPIDNAVNPIPIQPIQPITTVGQIDGLKPVIGSEDQVQQQLSQQVMTPISQGNLDQSMSPIPPVQQAVNPVLKEFEVPVMANQIEPTIPAAPVQQAANPVLKEFEVPAMPSQVDQPIPVQAPINPVLQEFQQSTMTPSTFNLSEPAQVIVPTEKSTLEQTPSVTPLSGMNNPSSQQVTNPGSSVSNTTNTNSLDIFGQPLN